MSTISIELGRANVSGNEIIFEAGRLKHDTETPFFNKVGQVVWINAELTSDNRTCIWIYVNGKLAAKGRAINRRDRTAETGIVYVVILDVIDESSGILSLAKDNVLHYETVNREPPCTLYFNGKACAKGFVGTVPQYGFQVLDENYHSFTVQELVA